MPDIRVDPEELAKAAPDLERAAERLRELAAEALEAGDSAPSYDGQFGPQVQRLGLEAHSALSSQAQRLALHGEELANLSMAFAEADAETRVGFDSIWAWLSDWMRKAEESLPAWLMLWIGRGHAYLPMQPSKPGNHGFPPAPSGLASPTPTSTPEVISTPMPPKVPPGHTPTPPGWTPPPKPTPTPSVTPTFEELQAQRAAAWEEYHSKWLMEFTSDLEGCAETADPSACITYVARSIYDHRGVPLEALAAAKEDNPLPADSLEFSLLTQMAIHNQASPENPRFVGQLGLRTEHIPNYEPAYLQALRAANPLTYVDAVEWREANRDLHEVWDEIFVKKMFEWAHSGAEW